MTSDWRVYLVRCKDNSLYCGISKDVSRRVTEHNTSKKGAKYTSGRRPVVLVAASGPLTHYQAMRLERCVKGLRKEQKLKHLVFCNLPHDRMLAGRAEVLSIREEA